MRVRHIILRPAQVAMSRRIVSTETALLTVVQHLSEGAHRSLISHTIHKLIKLVFLSLADALQLLKLVANARLGKFLGVGSRIVTGASRIE